MAPTARVARKRHHCRFASLRVLEKAGFRREGLAARYLRINGAWEDHILLAITLEEWAASGQ